MEILVLIAVLTGLVWTLVFLKHQGQTQANLVPLLGFLAVLAGSIFGFEFLHLSGGPIPITLDRLMVGGLVALFGLHCLRGSESFGPLNRADIVILVLILGLVFSAMSHDWHFRNNRPVSRLLFLYLMPLAVYFVMRFARLGIPDLKWFSILLGGFGLYLAITAIAETRDWSWLVFPGYIMNSPETEFLGRGRGPFLNPISNGVFQIAGVCALWIWWPRVRMCGQVMLLLFTGVMAIGIFCTLTRSVWLSFLMATALFVWYPASRQTKGLLIILATLAFVVSIPLVGNKMNSFKRDKEVSQADMEQSAQLRPLFAIVAWNMFQDKPIFGCGFGQYAQAKFPYLQDPYSGRPLSITKSWMQHNVFLAFLTETGLVGLLLLIAMLTIMTGISWSVWNNRKLNDWAQSLGLLMIVSLVNYTVNGMFHDVSIMPMQNMLLFLMFAVVNNIYTSPESFLVSSPIPENAAEADCATARPAHRQTGSTLSTPSRESIPVYQRYQASN